MCDDKMDKVSWKVFIINVVLVCLCPRMLKPQQKHVKVSQLKVTEATKKC
jgi:hypothetical protein